MTEQVETVHDALDEYIARYSNWGRWGNDDQCGTANHITPSHVRRAASLVSTGEVVPLALQFDQNGPQTGANGRFNCLRYSVATGTDHALRKQMWAGGPLPREMGYADDTVVLHLQSATHWDSLCHIFHRGRMYNGYAAEEFTAGGGARNGTEALRASLVGRGVLLDIPRSKGRPWLDDGYAITADDLDAAAELAKVEVRAGPQLLHDPVALGPQRGGGRERNVGRRGAPERAALELPAVPHPRARLYGAADRRDVQLRGIGRGVRRRRALRDARVGAATRVHRYGGRPARPGGDPLGTCDVRCCMAEQGPGATAPPPVPATCCRQPVPAVFVR